MPISTPTEALLPDELSSISYPDIAGVVVKYNNQLRTTDKTTWRAGNWLPDIVQYSSTAGSSKIKVWYDQRIDIIGEKGITMEFRVGNLVIANTGWSDYRLQMFNAQHKTYLYDDLYLYPANTYSIWAKAFNIWSSKAFKEDIQDLDGFKARLLALRPRAYKDFDGTQKIGLVAEETDTLHQEAAIDPEGEKTPAINIMAIMTDLLATVQDIEARVSKLEFQA